MQANLPLKARAKGKQKLEELQQLLVDHKQADKARQYAVRYHKASAQAG